MLKRRWAAVTVVAFAQLAVFPIPSFRQSVHAVGALRSTAVVESAGLEEQVRVALAASGAKEPRAGMEETPAGPDPAMEAYARRQQRPYLQAIRQALAGDPDWVVTTVIPGKLAFLTAPEVIPGIEPAMDFLVIGAQLAPEALSDEVVERLQQAMGEGAHRTVAYVWGSEGTTVSDDRVAQRQRLRREALNPLLDRARRQRAEVFLFEDPLAAGLEESGQEPPPLVAEVIARRWLGAFGDDSEVREALAALVEAWKIPEAQQRSALLLALPRLVTPLSDGARVDAAEVAMALQSAVRLASEGIDPTPFLADAAPAAFLLAPNGRILTVLLDSAAEWYRILHRRRISVRRDPDRHLSSLAAWLHPTGYGQVAFQIVLDFWQDVIQLGMDPRNSTLGGVRLIAARAHNAAQFREGIAWLYTLIAAAQAQGFNPNLAVEQTVSRWGSSADSLAELLLRMELAAAFIHAGVVPHLVTPLLSNPWAWLGADPDKLNGQVIAALGSDGFRALKRAPKRSERQLLRTARAFQERVMTRRQERRFQGRMHDEPLFWRFHAGDARYTLLRGLRSDLQQLRQLAHKQRAGLRDERLQGFGSSAQVAAWIVRREETGQLLLVLRQLLKAWRRADGLLRQAEIVPPTPYEGLVQRGEPEFLPPKAWFDETTERRVQLLLDQPPLGQEDRELLISREWLAQALADEARRGLEALAGELEHFGILRAVGTVEFADGVVWQADQRIGQPARLGFWPERGGRVGEWRFHVDEDNRLTLEAIVLRDLASMEAARRLIVAGLAVVEALGLVPGGVRQVDVVDPMIAAALIAVGFRAQGDEGGLDVRLPEQASGASGELIPLIIEKAEQVEVFQQLRQGLARMGHDLLARYRVVAQAPGPRVAVRIFDQYVLEDPSLFKAALAQVRVMIAGKLTVERGSSDSTEPALQGGLEDASAWGGALMQLGV